MRQCFDRKKSGNWNNVEKDIVKVRKNNEESFIALGGLAVK